jgi:hypothetical protein
MRKSVTLSLAAATALAGALSVVSSTAKADVNFGLLTPTPACGPVSGVGSVCAPNETFTGTFGEQVVAHGFPGAPAAGAGTSNLTLKPIPPNTTGESGLGVQSNNTSTTCTDPDCEIVPPQSVSVTRLGNTQITDAVIGSVQAGETFNFFTENTDGGPFTLLAANVTSTCIGTGFSVGSVAQTCQWNAPAGQFRFGVAVQAVATDGSPLGDVLLTSVSSVPGPIVGAGLPGLVAACGGLIALARRRRRQMA